MADSTNKVLLIFVKNTEKGAVKTRLARTIGDEQALNIYRKLLRMTKLITEPLDVTKQVWYASYIDEQDLWSEGAYHKRLQRGQDLGERMKVAFREAFDEGFEKVVIIGSDCADLSSKLLQQAFDLLDEHEVVVGPSEDGGYYLLGMTAFYPDLFDGKRWSTPSVFRETLRQVQQKGLAYYVLPTLNDIDTEEDLRASGIDIAKSDRECNSL